MSKRDALLDNEGKKVILMGNQAIARGFLEGGIDLAVSYPGTPSSEIMETLISMSKEYNFYSEWSVNEKVAAEVAIASSLCGLRSMVSMKGVGVNVASEPFQAFTYMGVKGGIVLVTADDPGLHSSHTEQDNRFFAREAYLPIFEPIDAREARDMARDALFYSEKWEQPIMLRITTRIAHTSVDIELGEIKKDRRVGHFEKNPTKWVNLPRNARKMRKKLIERMDRISKEVNKIPYNNLEGDSKKKYGIITSGISYGYVKEALNLLKLNDKINVLKISTPYPIPELLVEKFLSISENVLVVEEVEPFVEMQVSSLANKLDICIPIKGKEFLPTDGELSTLIVLKALYKFLVFPKQINISDFKIDDNIIPVRPPVLCPGCGHRSAFYAINNVEDKLRKKNKDFKFIIKPSDIGCYTLGYQQPLNAVDVHFCMGASIGISCGLAKSISNNSINQPIVCTIGDSTFFHAGIPPLLNAVFNNANITVLILDNSTTAMTGFQPHPGVGKVAKGDKAKMIKCEDIAKACGVEFIRVVDSYNLSKLTEAIEESVRFEKVGVIIARRLCRMLKLKDMRKKGEKLSYVYVDEDECKNCKLCIEKFGCPAMYLENDKVKINRTLCNSCLVCTQKLVCPTGAIKLRKVE